MTVEVTSKRKLRNTDEAADRLGVSPQFLRRRRRLRLSPDFIRLGDRILYSDESLDKLIEQNTVKAQNAQADRNRAA